MKKYFKNTGFLIGFLMVGAVFVFMLIGFVYTPFEPELIDSTNKLSPPSLTHLLGTDTLGRDVLSRMLTGSRISFLIGGAVCIIGGFFGTVIGAIAGYYGGKIDSLITKLIDTQMAFPGILIALMFIALLGRSVTNLILALSVMSIPRFARMSRGAFMKYKEQDFVSAARVRGASDLRIMAYHILPNITQELSVTVTLSFSSAIMSEAGLSYLGLGIAPPQASFGNILSEAQTAIFSAPWFVFIPMSAIVLLVLGFNLMSDAMQEINAK